MRKENSYYYHTARNARREAGDESENLLATGQDLDLYRSPDGVYSFDPDKDRKITRWISTTMANFEKSKRKRGGV